MKDQPLERHRRSRSVNTDASAHRRIQGNLLAVILALVLVISALGQTGSSITSPDSNVQSSLLTGSGSYVWGAIAGILFFILLNGVVVLCERAVESLRSAHVRAATAKSQNLVASRLERVFEDRHKIAAACALASQITRVTILGFAFLLSLSLAAKIEIEYAWKPGFTLILVSAIAVAIPVILLNLVVGEMVPRSFAELHPGTIAFRLYRFMQLISFAFNLPSRAVVAVANLLANRFGGRASLEPGEMVENEIITLVESAEKSGAIESEESELIQSALDFSDTLVREVMTPRTDLDAMPIESDPSEIITLIKESGHSRIPLYEGTDDQILGVIHAKELLISIVEGTNVSLRSMMRPAVSVPGTVRVSEALTLLREKKSQMAVVLDEYGGTAGIVTIEDIVEELFGEIQDEYDFETPEVAATSKGFSIDGKTHLDDVNDELGANLESEDFDTVGGYVFGLFGKQPKLYEFIEAEGFRFTVTETDGRRIIRLLVEPASQPASELVG